MKNKIRLLLVLLMLVIFAGCDKNNNNNNDNPIIDKEEYINIVYLDEDGKALSSERIKSDEEIKLREVPKKEYYDSKWVLLASSTNDIKYYQVEYTLNKTEFNINYNINDSDLYYDSKNGMVKSFLYDFYEFLNPDESLFTFLYGDDLSIDASLENGNFKLYFGGRYSKNNRLLYNNDIEENNDNYFFNSSSYKAKWYHLSSYIRDNICAKNKRFGYVDGDYNNGVLDFYRYLLSIDNQYIYYYGGEEIFYGYPQTTINLKTSYQTNNNECLTSIYNDRFLGWYDNPEYSGEKITSLNACIGDLNLYPKWNDNNYKIIYLDDNGEIVQEIEVNSNDTINLPTIEKAKAKFIGWYLQTARANDFAFNYDCDITLKAKWNYDDVNDFINLEYDGKTVCYNDTKIAVSFYEDYVEKEAGSEELRAVWVSSFVKGFTPSSDEATMKNELTRVLNVLEMYNINCVFFHLRTHNNAFYKTMLAPTTSKYGDYGDYEDFESFDYVPWLIEECHKRNMEFHAWLNPYRIELDGYSWEATTEDVAAKYKDFPLNPASKAENILLTYGSKEKGTRGAILNPAKKEVQDYLVDVVNELMNNYDIDGIHFDDYFYAKLNETETILDDDDQQDYLDALNKLSSIHEVSEEDKANWRRTNVNTLIYKLHQSISEYNKTNNKTIQFGISPTSIYRNGDGSIESGANVSYRGHYGPELYADTYLWAKNGWIDYLMPQLYVSFMNDKNSFADMAEWWNRAFEGLDCNLYFGLSNYKMLTDAGSWSQEEELFNQLKYIQTLKNCKGVSLFSSTYLVNDTLDTSSKTYSLYKRLMNDFWTKAMKVPKSRLK